MIFNDRINAALSLFFMVIGVVVILACAREWIPIAMWKKTPVGARASFVQTKLAAGGTPAHV